MKRNYIQYSALLFLGMFMFTSCSNSFLDVVPKGQSLESNYYSNPDEAFAGVVAAYSALNTETFNTYSSTLGPLNSASDDCYAGGGSSSDMSTWQVWNNYTLTSAQGPESDFWGINFTGVAKCNTILSKLDGVPGLSDALKSRYTAEAKFLRAHYYFDLVRLFGNVPLMTNALTLSDVYSQKQAKPAEVYAQVEKDLTEAIPDLPAKVPQDENGRVTQGAAKALLGKVYLYEQKWSLAASMLADVNGPTPGQENPTYGYKLLANYADIFSPDNKFNSESIFEIQHTGTQNYGWGNWGSFKSNVYVQMVGPRSYSGPTYSAGWGFNPITMSLVNVLKNDPRYNATVVNMDSLQAAGVCSYSPSYQNTGYFIKKYAPLLKYKTTTGTAELNYPNDYIEIRLADTYLMEAEALVHTGSNSARAQALLDAVRARVGLGSVPATLDNIYKERRLELATEGHRWFDLVRTGRAATVLGPSGFVAGKNELLPIPLAELTNTQLVQNPGY